MSAGFDTGLDRFAGRLAALPAEAAGRVAALVLDAVVERTPVATGRLRNGWRIADEAAVVRVVNDVPYAARVEYGTRGRAGAAMAREGALAVDAAAVLREIAP